MCCKGAAAKANDVEYIHVHPEPAQISVKIQAGLKTLSEISKVTHQLVHMQMEPAS
jgi:hypothetical protein